jgi:hypothetical protein
MSIKSENIKKALRPETIPVLKLMDESITHYTKCMNIIPNHPIESFKPIIDYYRYQKEILEFIISDSNDLFNLSEKDKEYVKNCKSSLLDNMYIYLEETKSINDRVYLNTSLEIRDMYRFIDTVTNYFLSG